MKRSDWVLTILLPVISACQPAEPQATLLSNEPMMFDLPFGIDAPPPVPEDNPMTPAKVELGRQLFFDARLSSDGTVSCATCHSPVMGFTDGRATSMGTQAQVGGRSAPSIINLAYAPNGVFWDGRAASLEEQAVGPIASSIEMSNTHENAVARLNTIPGYREQFEHVFGSPEVTIENVGKAIAAFERTVIAGNAPWDRFIKRRGRRPVSGGPPGMGPVSEQGELSPLPRRVQPHRQSVQEYRRWIRRARSGPWTVWVHGR